VTDTVGFSDSEGRIGIRNHVAIVYTTNCAEVVARSIRERFSGGTQLFGYPKGCSYQDALVARIVAMAQLANYVAVVRDVREAIGHAERESFKAGLFHIGFGNIEGGLTTIEEKSYGCAWPSQALALYRAYCASTVRRRAAFSPMIKVMANPHRMQLIRDNVDFDATSITRGGTLNEMTDELYAEVTAVAAGKLTKSENREHFEG